MKHYALISTLKMLLVIIFFSSLSAILGFYYCKLQILDKAEKVTRHHKTEFNIEDIEIIVFGESQL